MNQIERTRLANVAKMIERAITDALGIYETSTLDEALQEVYGLLNWQWPPTRWPRREPAIKP